MDDIIYRKPVHVRLRGIGRHGESITLYEGPFFLAEFTLPEQSGNLARKIDIDGSEEEGSLVLRAPFGALVARPHSQNVMMVQPEQLCKATPPAKEGQK